MSTKGRIVLDLDNEAHLAMPGTQVGDPAKAAAAIVTVATAGNGPLHQILATDSLGLA